MNIKKFLPLIAAAGLGLVVLILFHSGLGHSSDKGGKTVHVIVARDTIAQGEELTANNVADKTLDAANVPATAFTSIDNVIHRVASDSIPAGQPVLAESLAAPGLADRIDPQKRAVTIEVTETTGLAGLLVPGARVDLVAVINQGDQKKVCARTIASYIRVVAVGQSLTSNKPQGDNGANTGLPRTVTLVADPREVELIKLASLCTNLSLVMRRDGDRGSAEGGTVSMDDLSPPKKDPAVASAAPTPRAPTTQQATAVASSAQPTSHIRRVEIIQGGNISTVSFDMPDASNAPDPDDYGVIDPTR